MRRIKPVLWVALGAAVTALCSSQEIWAQCAMCRTALLKSPEGQKLAGAFNSSILFLLSAPFVIGGGVALAILKARLATWFRRAARITSDAAR